MKFDLSKMGRAFAFFRNVTDKLDINDPTIRKDLESQNPSLLLEYYKKMNDKTRAINLLYKLKKVRNKDRMNLNIIYTFIYFEDIQGAISYIQQYEITNVTLRYQLYLLYIYRAMQQNEYNLNQIMEWILEGIKSTFDRNFIDALKYFLKKYEKDSFQDIFKEKLNEIEPIFTEKYLSDLGYKDYKFLYKTMPDKAKYLALMVQSNPGIKKKYFIAYIKIFGIHSEDILRIIKRKYRSWAVRIAIDKGILDIDAHHVVEEHFKIKHILAINDAEFDNHDKEDKAFTFFKFKTHDI